MEEDAIDSPVASNKELYHVFRMLDRLVPGETIIISEKAPNRPKIFIECCKAWIRCYPMLGEFNSDYSVFKRLDPEKDFYSSDNPPNWMEMQAKVFNKK